MSAVIPKSLDQVLPALREVGQVLSAAKRLIYDQNGLHSIGFKLDDAQDLVASQIELLQAHGLTEAASTPAADLVQPGPVLRI